MFPISFKVMFSVLFELFKAEITVSKLTLHLMGKMLNELQDKVWNLECYILENFYFIFITFFLTHILNIYLFIYLDPIWIYIYISH